MHDEEYSQSLTPKTYVDEYGVESLHTGDEDIYKVSVVLDEKSGVGEGISNDSTKLKSVQNLERLRREFDKMKPTGNIFSDKIKNDSGIIAVYGDSQSGVSGIVANLGEIYGSAQRQVLIIDLDLLNRQQTKYFPLYEYNAKRNNGVVNGLSKAIRGGSISRTSVDITSKISILGTGSKEKYTKQEQLYTIRNIRKLLHEAVLIYDIVIIDIPHNFIFESITELQGLVDNFIMVTTDLPYRNEVFFEHILMDMVETDENLMVNIFKRTQIIVNKINKNHRILIGKNHSNSEFRENIWKLGYPFDRLYMLGEFPYYDTWETQYAENFRLIWGSKLLMYMYADLVNKLFLN